MKRNILPSAEHYLKHGHRRRVWRKIVQTMTCAVVFITTYALILPAITIERQYCGLEEHTHSQACYQKATTKTISSLKCSYASLGVHEHTADCYDNENNCVCGTADFVIHGHTADCTDEDGNLLCQLPVIQEHIHTVDCYQAEETEPSCGKEAICLHLHDDAVCYEIYPDEAGNEKKQLICTETVVPEHTHSESCFVTEEVPAADIDCLTCTLTEDHTHSEMCYGTWVLICGKEEHTHANACIKLKEEERVQVASVIDMIDAMPSSEEIDAKLEAYEADGDLAGQDAYFEDVVTQVCGIHDQYERLTDDQKACVSNAQKLLALEYMWVNREEASTYATTELEGYNRSSNGIIPIDGYLGREAGYKNGVKQQWSDMTKTILGSGGCNVIYVDLPAGHNLSGYLLNSATVNGNKQGTFSVDLYNDWAAIRVEPTSEYPFYYIAQTFNRYTSNKAQIGNLANTTDGGFILLVRRSYITEKSLWIPDGYTSNYGYVHLNKEILKYKKGWDNFEDDPGWLPSTMAEKITLGYVTLSPNDVDHNADARKGDKAVVDNIKFKLFDYSEYINKTSRNNSDSNVAREIHSSYRDLAKYFYFRGGIDTSTDRDYNLDVSKYTPNVNNAQQDGIGHSDYDKDGYDKYHARVEPNLYNGFPVLDFSKDATGAAMTAPTGFGANDDKNLRSLAYLFDGKIAHSLDLNNNLNDPMDLAYQSVTEYNPKNTILQFNEDKHTYWYNSAKNAVDYDIDEGMFRVRPYVERTSITADWMFGDSSKSGDFLPFNYSNGIVNATYHPSNGTDYYTNTDSSFRMNDVNYWFGMSMEFTFIQGADGTVTYTNSKGEKKTDPMKFTFAGDDDVWVFIDDVLILDLGGTHGSVTGTIDFTNGKITQKLGGDWTGTDAGSADEHSFPTTLQERFAAAGKAPKSGWDDDGTGTPNERFADYSIHTLKFFYLERGTAVANCRMEFNLPNFDNPLIVSKTLNAKDEDTNLEALGYLRDTTEYSFRILETDQNGNIKKDDDGNPILFMEEGQEYTVVEYFQTMAIADDDDDAADATQTVGENGIFKLKHGQQAVFEDILAIADYSDKYFVVEELLPENQTGHYNMVQYTIDANGGVMAGKDDIDLTEFTGFYCPAISAGEPQHVQFTNVVDTETLSVLKVTKSVSAVPGVGTDPFTIRVKMNDEYLPEGYTYKIGSAEYQVGVNGSIELKNGQTAEFLVLALAGTTYEVEEVVDSTWKVSYKSVTTDKDGAKTTTKENSGEFPMDGSVKVTVTNTQKNPNVKISVAKELTSTGTAAMLGDPDFRFKIMKANSNDVKTANLLFAAGTSFEIYEGATWVDTGTVGEDGIFTLKAGQRAEFPGYNTLSTRYYVREILDAELVDQYGAVKVNGKNATLVTIDDATVGMDSAVTKITAGDTTFTFDNKVEESKLGYLTISKEVDGTPPADTYFNMYVKLDNKPIAVGTPYDLYPTGTHAPNSATKPTFTGNHTVTTGGVIPVPHGYTAWIPNILPGTAFYMEEQSESSLGYSVTYEESYGGDSMEAAADHVAGTVPMSTSNAHVSVLVKNTEVSAALAINARKVLTNGSSDPDTTHTIKFTIELTKVNGNAPTAEQAYTETKSVDVKGEGNHNFYFNLNYQASDFPQDTTLTYLIKEINPGVAVSSHDTSKYYAEVKVTAHAASATLVSMKKDTKKDSDKIAEFSNTLRGWLYLKKVVVNEGSALLNTESYRFILKFTKADGTPLSGATMTYYEDASIGSYVRKTTEEDGTITIDGVKPDVEIKLGRVPLGTTWTIRETNTDGYTVSWSDGTTVTNGEAVSGSITPTRTHVTCTNTVDETKVSTLAITKAITSGSTFKSSQTYTVRVKVGGEYLPEGTTYTISGTEYAVGANGSIVLKKNQTAEIRILTPTDIPYEVEEVVDDSWVVTYENQTGTLSPGTRSEVTITNSTYECSTYFTHAKRAYGLTKPTYFSFYLEQVDEDGNPLPEEQIVATYPTDRSKILTQVDEVTSRNTYIYFNKGVAPGNYYFALTEYDYTERYTRDTDVYIIKVRVYESDDGVLKAEVDSVTKDGAPFAYDKDDNPMLFVNRRKRSVVVDKTVIYNDVSETGNEAFSFTAVVTLEGKQVIPDNGTGYTVAEDGTVTFKLGHQDSVTIQGIPYGAKIVVTEAEAPGFATYYTRNSSATKYTSNVTKEITVTSTQKIHFVNKGGYALPNTGGVGTTIYTMAGLVLILLGAAYLMYTSKARRREGYRSP